MHIRLSEHFTYGKLLRFTFPTVVMLIFTSIYGVVDGVFVSNYAGKTAFAAVNLIMPALMIFATVGFMLGTGGSAVVARTMGEGDLPRANRYFSLIVFAGFLAGAVLTVIAELTMEPLCLLLGATGELLPLAKEFYTVTPDSPRAMPAGELAAWLERQGVKAFPCGSVREGLKRSLEASGPEDVVCATGSLYMIGEVRHLLGLC